MKILLALPGKYYSNHFITSLINFIHNCYQNNITVITAQRHNSFLPYCRASTLGANNLKGSKQKLFQGNLDVDFVLMIDSDQVFTFNDFMKLVNLNVDFASGVYLMDTGKYTCIVPNIDDNYFLQYGTYKFITKDEILQFKEPFTITGYVGLGFCLIKPHILEKIEYPWFASILKKFPNGVQEIKSEDASFCERLVNAGIKLYIHPDVRIGHEKTIIY
jgi:hypothetical protein